MAVGVLAVAGLGVTAFAQGPASGADRERPRRLQERLGLTDAQMEQLRDMRAQHAKEAIRRAADLRIARLELRELLDAPAPDEKAIGAKVRAITDLQASAVRAQVDRELALRKTLTPEQVKQLREHRREVGRHFRARRHEMRHGEGRRGPRPGFRRGPGGPRADDALAAPGLGDGDERGEADQDVVEPEPAAAAEAPARR